MSRSLTALPETVQSVRAGRQSYRLSSAGGPPRRPRIGRPVTRTDSCTSQGRASGAIRATPGRAARDVRPMVGTTLPAVRGHRPQSPASGRRGAYGRRGGRVWTMSARTPGRQGEGRNVTRTAVAATSEWIARARRRRRRGMPVDPGRTSSISIRASRAGARRGLGSLSRHRRSSRGTAPRVLRGKRRPGRARLFQDGALAYSVTSSPFEKAPAGEAFA